MRSLSVRLLTAAAALSSIVEASNAGRPIVIAHRGASGYLPEHTLAAYRLAIEQRADFIEPDLVVTRDGVLIARHDNWLNPTTNVVDVARTSPDIDALKTAKTVKGTRLTGWFAEDLTLAQIKKLRSRERREADLRSPFRPANAKHDDRYPIPTLAEVIDLAREAGVGIYPETKLPSFLQQATGINTSEVLLDTLQRAGVRNFSDLPTYIQSFEADNLKWLHAEMRRRGMNLPLVQLLGRGEEYGQMATREGLLAIAGYAAGVGPEKNHFVIPKDRSGRLLLANAARFVDDAHAAGLVVHPFTFRAENRALPVNFRRGEPAADLQHGDAEGEIELFLAAGIDGFFTDHPDVGVRAVAKAVVGANGK